MNKRPMPEDFREHADETLDALKVRYHASNSVLCRWRKEVGVLPKKRKRPVQQIDRATGDVIQTFPSVSAAAQAMWGSTAAVYMVCVGKQGSAYGFLWRYAEE